MGKNTECHPAPSCVTPSHHPPPPLLPPAGLRGPKARMSPGVKVMGKAQVKDRGDLLHKCISPRRPLRRERQQLPSAANYSCRSSVCASISPPLNEGRKTVGFFCMPKAAISSSERRGRGWRQESTGRAAEAWNIGDAVSRGAAPQNPLLPKTRCSPKPAAQVGHIHVPKATCTPVSGAQESAPGASPCHGAPRGVHRAHSPGISGGWRGKKEGASRRAVKGNVSI